MTILMQTKTREIIPVNAINTIVYVTPKLSKCFFPDIFARYSLFKLKFEDSSTTSSVLTENETGNLSKRMHLTSVVMSMALRLQRYMSEMTEHINIHIIAITLPESPSGIHCGSRVKHRKLMCHQFSLHNSMAIQHLKRSYSNWNYAYDKILSVTFHSPTRWLHGTWYCKCMFFWYIDLHKKRTFFY